MIGADADVNTIFAVIVLIALGVFIAIWGVSRASASKADVAELRVWLGALEDKAEGTQRGLIDLERAVSHLPTDAHVHQLDVRLERVTTIVEATAKQIDRMYDHWITQGPAEGAK